MLTTKQIVDDFLHELSGYTPGVQIHALKLLALKLAYELEPSHVEDICGQTKIGVEDRTHNAIIQGIYRRAEERAAKQVVEGR